MRANGRLIALLSLTAFVAACSCDGTLSSASPFCRSDSSSTRVSGLHLTADSTMVLLVPTTTSTVMLSLASIDSSDYPLLLPNNIAINVHGAVSSPTIRPGQRVALQLTASAVANPQFPETYVVRAVKGNERDSVTIQVQFAGPFTTLAAPPTTIVAGNTATASVVLRRARGFQQPIGIAVQGFPAGWTATLSAATTTDSIVPITIAVPAGTTAGNYQGTFTATYQSTVQQVAVPVIVTPVVAPDFSLAVAPDSIVVVAGQAGSAVVSVSRTLPSVGPVTMSVSGLPTAATATSTPNAADDTTRLAISTTAATPPGRYPIIVRGTAVSLTRLATATLVVNAAPPPPPPSTLTVAVAPAALNVVAGNAGNVTVTTQTTGTVGPITFDVLNLPAGVTASFTTAASNQGPVTTLTVAVASTVPNGTYPLTVRAIAGTLVAATSLTLSVVPPAGDFLLLIPTPTPLIVPFGTTRFVTVHIERQGQFVGFPLRLSVPTPIVGGSAWVAPSVTTGDSATLEIIGGSAAGYDITVLGTGGGVTRSFTITISGAQNFSPEFWIAPAQKEVTAPRGVVTPITLLVQRLQGHSDPMTFTSTDDSPGNWTVTFTPSSLASGSTAPVRVDVTAGANVASGPHVLVLRAQASGVERRALVTVIVP